MQSYVFSLIFHRYSERILNHINIVSFSLLFLFVWITSLFSYLCIIFCFSFDIFRCERTTDVFLTSKEYDSETRIFLVPDEVYGTTKEVDELANAQL